MKQKPDPIARVHLVQNKRGEVIVLDAVRHWTRASEADVQWAIDSFEFKRPSPARKGRRSHTTGSFLVEVFADGPRGGQKPARITRVPFEFKLRKPRNWVRS